MSNPFDTLMRFPSYNTLLTYYLSCISGGPSEGKLQSEDQILEINGEDVSKAPRDRVIELVK